ncbi:MAG: hypothetical protein JXB88_25965 [Spirochaetales bacterium]|nr:hypothetical protein [Spirochaetales bacterium]
MEENNSHIFTFNTFEDIDLYELSETTRNEDYKKLSEWICHYKYRQIETHNAGFIFQKRKEYKHEFSVLIELIDSYIRIKTNYSLLSLSNLTEISRIKKRIRFMCSEIFRNISISDVQRKTLRQYLVKNRFTKEFKAFLVTCFTGRMSGEKTGTPARDNEETFYSHSDTQLKEYIEKMFSGKEGIITDLEYIDPDAFMIRYEEKLKDHIFLLDELVEILSEEYDRRVISTKARFEEYLRPRKRVLEKIEEEIAEIKEDLALLKEDENIGEEDREKLVHAFLHKKEELNNLKLREYEKLNSIKMVSVNIKNGVAQFRELIDKLKKKLRYFKKRQFYVEKLARYGAEIPRFRNILDDLYSTFNAQIKTLQKSFLLFDMSFQETIFHAIEDQSVINRIILSPSGIVDAELAIENIAAHSLPSDIHEETTEIVDTIELDLSFLQPYEAERKGTE